MLGGLCRSYASLRWLLWLRLLLCLLVLGGVFEVILRGPAYVCFGCVWVVFVGAVRVCFDGVFRVVLSYVIAARTFGFCGQYMVVVLRLGESLLFFRSRFFRFLFGGGEFFGQFSCS